MYGLNMPDFVEMGQLGKGGRMLCAECNVHRTAGSVTVGTSPTWSTVCAGAGAVRVLCGCCYCAVTMLCDCAVTVLCDFL